MTKIIVDAMGSDLGPDMVIEAIGLALKARDFECVVVGPQEKLLPAFHNESHVEVLDAQDVITNEEAPVMAVRRKKESSLVKGLEYFNEEGDAFVSAGSTGALLSGGYFITKRIAGMKRLCLAPLGPSPHGGFLIADGGATMDTTPEMLLQFATITSLYAEKALGRKNPSVGLLNIGVEADKGDKRSIAAYQLLSQSALNFVGNIEARDVLFSSCDVIVTDGFAGNIAIKSIEGTAKATMKILRSVLMGSLKGKLGGLLIKDELKKQFAELDYRKHGGAPLLGARKPIYKAHGNSSAQTFSYAILEALDFAESGVVEEIRNEMEAQQEGKNEDE